jgi:hypothetical protein
VRFALVRFVASLGVLVSLGCGIPLGAIRRSPPDGIDARVLPARATAPDFTLEGTAGRFHLADAVARENVLLVFYRGHW